jgi:hypothetical protein
MTRGLNRKRPPTEAPSIQALAEFLDDLPQVACVLFDDAVLPLGVKALAPALLCQRLVRRALFMSPMVR